MRGLETHRSGSHIADVSAVVLFLGRSRAICGEVIRIREVKCTHNMLANAKLALSNMTLLEKNYLAYRVFRCSRSHICAHLLIQIWWC